MVNSNLNLNFQNMDDKFLDCLEQIFEGYNSIGTVSINMGVASVLNQTRKSDYSANKKLR